MVKGLDLCTNHVAVIICKACAQFPCTRLYRAKLWNIAGDGENMTTSETPSAISIWSLGLSWVIGMSNNCARTEYSSFSRDLSSHSHETRLNGLRSPSPRDHHASAVSCGPGRSGGSMSQLRMTRQDHDAPTLRAA
jgi:hypothetical protein